MRYRGIVLSSVVFVAVLMAFSNSAALACGPAEFDAPSGDIWCEVRARTFTPVPPPTPPPAMVALAPVSVQVAAPPVSVQVAAPAKPAAAPIIQKGGDSPANARDITDDDQFIDPGARLWYKAGSNGMHIDVAMLTYGQPGLNFSVYAPNNQNFSAPDLKPTGVGTYSNSDPNTLRWAGGSMSQRGTWYALVTNTSAARLKFKMGSSQSTVDKTCVSYWETLPSGQYVYWTKCY